MSKYRWVLGFAIFFTATGCQQASDLKDMHESTEHMSSTTDKLLDATHGLSSTISKMGDQTGIMSKEITPIGEMSKDMKVLVAAFVELRKVMNGMYDEMKGMHGEISPMRKNMDVILPFLKQVLVEMGKVERMMKGIPGLAHNLQKTVDIAQGLCKGSRQALAMLDREQSSIQLQNHASEQLTKVERAGEYLQGFEYHAWGLCDDATEESRLQLMNSATEEFFLHMKDITSLGQEASPISSVQQIFSSVFKDTVLGRAFPNYFQGPERDSAFNAVAAALDEVNDLQRGILAQQKMSRKKKQPAAPIVNMLTMIEEALRAQQKVDQGQLQYGSLPAYQKTILNHRQTALRLLEARVNILRINVGQKLMELTQNKIGTTNTVLDSGQLKAIDLGGKFGLLQSLKNSLETSQFLSEIHETHATDPIVKSLLMNSTPGPVVNDKSSELTTLRKQFMTELRLVQAELQTEPR